jgi:cell wall-associated NlpC family hydrolase
MIFKTFDSDKDTFSSKFGIFGKSFEDIGNRFKKVSDELIVTNDYTISNIANAWKNSSVKKDLSDKFIITKSDIQDKLKDLSVYEKNPQGILDNLLEQKELVDSNQSSWQKYFEGLSEGEKWQVKFVQENDLTKVSLDDVKNAQNAARQSAIAYNNGLEQMTIGAKAANIALEGLKMAANMIAGMLIAEGIQLAVTAIDNYIHRVEKANEAMNEAVSEYDSAKTALKDTTSQLEEQNKSIDELNKKDKLTYVEQEELDKLKEATRQLELQKNIEEKEKANSAREAADKTVTAFNKQYGKGDIDKNAVDTQLAQSKATGVFQEARNSDDIVGNLASFEYYTEQMEKTQKRYNKALKSGSKDDIKYYEENLQDCIDTVDEYTTSLNNNIEDLTKKKNNLQDAYDNAVKKKSNGESLSSDEKNTISKYQEIADIIKLIYSYTDKAGWNNSQISEIFNTNGIEKSKEDLKQLAQEGKLTEEELQKYPNLMNAINNAEFLGEKDSNLKVFCDDLNAGVDAIEDTGNAADSAAPSIASFDEAWLNLKNTDDSDLKGAADDLLDLANAGQLTGNALEGLAGGQQLMNETGLSAEALAQKINGLVNASTQLSSMSTQISKISDMLADKKNGTVASASDLAGFDVSVRGLESWDEFEEVMGSSESSMDQCQKAANALATEWVNDGNFLANLTDENKQYYITQLEDMGVKNAEQIVTEALAKKEEELRFEKLLSADASTDLQNATVADILKLQNLGDITEQEKAKLAAFTLEKQYCNKNTIVTDADCQNIYTLAKMAGAGTEALNKLAALKQRLSDNPIMSNEMRNNINNAIQDIVNGVTTSAGAKLDIPQVKVNSSGSSSYKSPSSKKSKSKSKTKSDAAEVFDFIEIKLNNLTDKASKAKDKIDDLLTFGQKKNQTKKAIEATTKAITAQEKAYKKYMAYANKAAKTQNSKKTTSSSSSTGGNAVYDTATDYLGLKYVWGGASLTKGADCSGFTQQIYKKFGVSLPHHAADQAKMGTKITSKKNLQAGDLVFFGSKNNITHVGIYGGDGKFIESPHTGASVRVSKLSSRKDFVSGSRFSKINNATSTSSSSGKNVKKVKKGVSSKTLEHYKKLIRNGTLDADGIQTIKNENLKNAMKDYQTWYEKAKSCKEQVTSLTDQLKDLYETLANNPIDSASDKIEKLGTKMDILNAKVGNLTFNPTKKIGTSDIDNLYKQIIKNYNSQLSASKTAYTGATKSYKSNKSSLTKSLKKTKAKNIGLTQKEFNSIKSSLKSNKDISYNLVNKIINDSLREKCIAHNEYLLAKNTAADNYNQAKEDHTSNVRQTRKDRFDKVQARYDNKAGLIEQKKNAVSNSLSIAEAKGQLIGDAYYTRQADAVKSDMQLKQEEAEKLAKKLSTIKFGSDEWYEAQEALNGVYESIQQDEQELAEFQKSINQLKFDRFDELLNKLGDITDETDFLIDMLDSDNLFDSDTGMISQDGITAMGLTAQNYDTYLAKAQEYKDAIADLNEMYKNGKIGLDDYNSQLRTYQQGQRDSIKSANEAKKSLVSYVKQGLDAQNDALSDAIDKKKKLLETEKD